MKKRKRSRSREAVAADPVTGGHAGSGVGAPIAWLSGYEGANFSTARGNPWWPSLDPRHELDSFSRAEILRRIHWLKGNFGFIRGIIRNTAELVGYQTPQAQSGNDDWDNVAEEQFRFVTGEAEAFDVAGKFDFADAQLMLMREALTDGDVLTVLTKWDNGAARVMFYKTSQLANPKDAGSEWRDGIKVVRGRHVAYGLRTGEKDAVMVVPASAVVYFGEFDAPGEDRPVPPLAHAVNHSVDITETWGFLKQAVKASSLFGVVREREGTAQPPRSRQGLTGAPRIVEDDEKDILVSDVWAGGQMPELAPGVKTKVLTDPRPHQNVQDQIVTLMRDVSEGFGLPLEVVWALVRMTGPGVRFVMSRADRWIKQRQKRQRRWGRRIWRYVIACEIERGALGMPPSDESGRQRWWAVSFTSQSNLTIDRGQVSRAMLDELDAGVTTMSMWEDVDGMDWKERMEQRVKEVKYGEELCRKAGIPYEKVFRARQGAAVVEEKDGGEEEEEEE